MHQHDAAVFGVDRTAEDDRLAVNRGRSARRRQMAGKDFHQGGFACAVLANDGMNFTGADFERDVLQHLNAVEGFGQTLSCHEALVVLRLRYDGRVHPIVVHTLPAFDEATEASMNFMPSMPSSTVG